MKKILIFIAIIAVCIFNSCVKLDLAPSDTLSEAVTFQDEAGCLKGIAGVYAYLHDQNCMGIKYFDDVLANYCVGRSGFEELANGGMNSSNNLVSSHWASYYEGVARANNVIQMVTKNAQILTASGMSDELQQRYIAEAKFLRGLYYFYLVDRFGDVPYYDETTIVSQSYNDMKKPRTSSAKVYENIRNDMDVAIAKLPKKWDTSNNGRATAGAAEALKAKTYLFEKNYAAAAPLFENVIKNYGYEIYPEYKDLFKAAGHASSEMIFSIQNISGSTNYGIGMPFAKFLGISNVGGWCRMTINTLTIDAYDYKDGKHFSWSDIFPNYPTDQKLNEVYNKTSSTTSEEYKALIKTRTDVWWCQTDKSKGFISCNEEARTKVLDMYKQRDPRMQYVAILPFTSFVGYNSGSDDPITYYPTVNDAQFGENHKGCLNAAVPQYPFRKFVPESEEGGAGGGDMYSTPINFPLIRLADVHLMLAECYAQTDKLDEAVKNINIVRARPSVNMPGINSGPAWLAATTKEQVMDWIKRERRAELIGEGHGYSDVRRWGELESFNGWVNFSISGYSNRYVTVSESRMNLWPIPLSEIDKNDKLTQNTGWQ